MTAPALVDHGLDAGTSLHCLDFSMNRNWQQAKTGRLVRWFEQTLNQGKPDREAHLQRFLSALNLQLFGYLGGVTLLEDENRASPFRDHLEVSKSLFRKDIRAMARQVSGWTIAGGRVSMPGDEGFRVGGTSEEFLKTLQTAHRFLFTRETLGMERYALDRLSFFFGTFPGETWGSVHVDSRNPTFWRPEETAKVVRQSLEMENSLYRVIRLLEKTHASQDLRLHDTGFRGSGRSARDLDWVDYIRGGRDVSHLKVTRIVSAEKYAESIPMEKFQAFENFIEINARELAKSIPFRLTPRFWILEGPVTQRRIVHPDPLILLEFEEFPQTFLPIEAWLPSAPIQVRALRPFQANRLDPGYTWKILGKKELH